MIRYILRKLGYGLAVMLGIVFVVFFLFNILPVDPARMTQGQRADVQSLQAVRKEFGLDKPIPVQFAYYLNDLSPIGIHARSHEEQQRYHYVSLIPISKERTLALKWPYLRRSYQTRKDVASLLIGRDTQYPDSGYHSNDVCHCDRSIFGRDQRGASKYLDRSSWRSLFLRWVFRRPLFLQESL